MPNSCVRANDLHVVVCIVYPRQQHGTKVLVTCPSWVHTDISINALDAHGQPNTAQDLTKENGISMEDCAEQIVHAMQRTETKRSLVKA